ncbi:hypothetical protein GCM10023142_16170 [Anaerocolumna aminovalerica]
MKKRIETLNQHRGKGSYPCYNPDYGCVPSYRDYFDAFLVELKKCFLTSTRCDKYLFDIYENNEYYF